MEQGELTGEDEGKVKEMEKKNRMEGDGGQKGSGREQKRYDDKDSVARHTESDGGETAASGWRICRPFRCLRRNCSTGSAGQGEQQCATAGIVQHKR